jgi:probable F420-dependent oxidoreductase
MVDVGRIGIWSGGLRTAELAVACDAAAELEALGFDAIWIPGRDDGVFERAAALLDATERIVVATGIASVWRYPAPEAAAAHARLTEAHPERFLLGIGISHAPIVERDGLGNYERPLAQMSSYLDGLDEAPTPVPREERVVAALAPRMLALAAERSRGTHPYLVTPEHTAFARETVGASALVAPEQGVVLERDPDRARALARHHLTQPYITLPNYRRNWERQGFAPADIEGDGSDRLVDGLVAWGDDGAIRRRVREHVDAGADHVCIQVLTGTRDALPREEWRALAPALVEATAR